jgi:hypothetical protein
MSRAADELTVCCRSRRLPVYVAILAVGVLAVADAAWSLPSRQIPELSIARAMLAALPLEERSLREAAVESTLARMPGAGETFLSGLMSWEYLTSRWSDPGLGAQPYARAEGSVYGNRVWGGGHDAMPVTVDLGSVSFRSSELLFTSPLILDLGRDGTPDVSSGGWEPHSGMDLNGLKVLFDIDGDGFPDLTEWVGPSDGILMLPANPASVGVGTAGDLTWTGPLSGRDLLGSAGGFPDGFSKLAESLGAYDGVVSGSDLDSLYVWRDLNQDAVIEPGELVRPQDLSITALHLPAAGASVGSFESAFGPGAMWDWWPSYLQGYRIWAPGASAPPSMVPLTDVALPNLAYLGSPLPFGANGWIDRASLKAAGLDFASVRLVGLSPGGSWLVLQDRMPALADVAAGLVRRLWILPAAEATSSVIPRIVPVPAADLLQFVFADDGTAFLVTDNGSSLLRLDLATGGLARVLAHHDGEAGLRLGNFAFRGPQGVCFSGWFHDAGPASRHESVVSYAEVSGAPALVETADRDLLLAGVAHLGDVAGEIPVSPTFAHFVVRTESGSSLLVVSREGAVVVADDNVLPNGLAASGDRVLYFRQTATQSEPEVRVFDALTDGIQVLGAGDYCYPYLTDGGTIAWVASFDWQAMTMTLWKAPVVPGAHLQLALATAGIGAVRVSENGYGLAYLGTDGLYRCTLAPTSVGSEAVQPLQLSQNHPNPFNPLTTLRFELPTAGPARLAVYDVAGRLVRVLVEGKIPAGSHEAVWDGRDSSGRFSPSGSYLARLVAGGKVEGVRLSLVR